jgi:Putative auto-transporter adhesin, head GIN domain
MLRVRRFALTLFLAASGCVGIEGSGHVVAQSRPAATFHRLSLDGTADVQIVRGQAPAITVITDDNLLRYVDTHIDSDELRISEGDSHGGHVALWPTSGIRVVLTVADAPTEIALGGSGSITFDDPSPATAGTLRLEMSGSGAMDLGAGVSELDVELSGTGSVRLHGTASRAVLDLSGSGTIDAFGLSLATARVSMSGSGLVRVAASESLEASVSGSGLVTYRGSPVVYCNISGSGSVRQD